MGIELIYMKDSYLKELAAKVVSVGENWVEVNKTIFYPLGGGQESDTGKILFNGKESRVKEVRKDSGIVKHFLEGEIPEKGTEVKLVLDWNRRYKIMRMHSAQHLLSALVLDLFKASTVGNQIHEDRSRMDFHPIKFSEEMLKELKEKFDSIVSEGKEIKIYETTREKVLEEVDEARRRLFSRVPERVKVIRVVDIPGIDKCPCAGTHVKNTKEIGKINILKTENKGKERERIDFALERKNHQNFKFLK
jgi:misacylated tRNA(Ala) deacylase